jgi:hypothetical protein
MIVFILFLFLLSLIVAGYFMYLRMMNERRIRNWEDKVNGNEIFIFSECDYREQIVGLELTITDPMRSMYSLEDTPIRSMIIPSGVTVNTHMGPKVLRCVDPITEIDIKDV